MTLDPLILASNGNNAFICWEQLHCISIFLKA